MSRIQTIEADGLDGTADVAAAIARRVTPGRCLTLEGDMGAGKTTFVAALVAAMGGSARDVSSPTYVLLNVYATPRMPVFHLDAFRLGGAADLEAIGFDELLARRGLVIVEWASRVVDALPAAGRIDVRIEPTGPTTRRFEIADLE